jgi:hypothetical protein
MREKLGLKARRASEGHSHSTECIRRDKSSQQDKGGESTSGIHFLEKTEGGTSQDSETKRARETHLLESPEGGTIQHTKQSEWWSDEDVE